MRIIHFSLLLFILLAVGHSGQGILPMREQWRAACRALGAGDATTALGLFREFDAWYAQEAAVREPKFREDWLRLWGLAALQAGDLSEGIRLLETWLAEFPDAGAGRAFIRFQLASACRSSGDADRAVSHWEAFLEEHSELPEAALVRWMWSDYLLESGELARAAGLLREIPDIPGLPPSAATLSRSALALVELSMGMDTAALASLNELEVSGAGPVSLWRSLLAPSLARSLLDGGRAEEAVLASRWFARPQGLRDDLNSLRQTLHAVSRSPGALRQSIWNRHWQGQVERMETALQESGLMVDADLLYSLRLRCLLKGETHAMAGILARAVIASPNSVGSGLLAEAYQAGIEAARELKDWARAESLAENFLTRFPEHPALPEVLALIAKTAAARGNHAVALAQIRRVQASFPAHRSVHSWRMLEGEWLLASSNPGAALEVFHALGTSAPKGWVAYLRFQEARCHEALKNLETAAEAYDEVASMEQASGSLQEFALFGLLKLRLRTFDPDKFLKVLDTYRRRFPEGLNAPMAENLAGCFHLRAGDVTAAEERFLHVAAQAHPAAAFARDQLSQLYRQSRDMARLGEHARDWIRKSLASEESPSAAAFEDANLSQQQTGRLGLNTGLAVQLIGLLDSQPRILPTGSLLSLLASGWEHYRALVPGSPPTAMDWCQERAAAHQTEGNAPAQAAYALFIADELERAGRIDSADARRIQLLQTIDPLVLGSQSLQTLARTADAYDFPQARPLLDLFLDHYPEAPWHPEALHRLAVRLRSSGGSRDPASLLREVVSDWPDADIHTESALLLAAWELEDGRPAAALGPVSTLLEQGGLSPQATARSLLLRARADFALGEDGRAALGCLRITSLYPDYHDICCVAKSLLAEHVGAISDPSQREQINALLGGEPASANAIPDAV